jgi:hypothetical protein
MYLVRGLSHEIAVCHIRKLDAPPHQENTAPHKSSIGLLLDAVETVESGPIRKSAAKLLDFGSEPDYVSLFYCQSSNKFPAFYDRTEL